MLVARDGDPGWPSREFVISLSGDLGIFSQSTIDDTVLMVRGVTVAELVSASLDDAVGGRESGRVGVGVFGREVVAVGRDCPGNWYASIRGMLKSVWISRSTFSFSGMVVE